MTTIAIFVGQLTKMAYFVHYKKEVTTKKYARLFIDHVFKLHGLLKVIISDHDPRFLSKFWDELFNSLGKGFAIRYSISSLNGWPNCGD